MAVRISSSENRPNGYESWLPESPDRLLVPCLASGMNCIRVYLTRGYCAPRFWNYSGISRMNIEPARRPERLVRWRLASPRRSFLLQEANSSAQMPDDYKTPDPAKILEGAKRACYGLTSNLAAAAAVQCTAMAGDRALNALLNSRTDRLWPRSRFWEFIIVINSTRSCQS
jgi:hypothetical protein